MTESENGNPRSDAPNAPSDGLRLDQIIRSDALGDLSDFCKRHPVFQQIIDEPLRIRLVLDANIVQRELRWRLRSRQKDAARSALHEAIDAGTVVPFAPTALGQEIDDHIPNIAEYARVTKDRVREEWANFQAQIHFYAPEVTRVCGNHVDPDDVPYKQTCIELGAHAVYTRDHHFESMDVPLLMVDLDKAFRKYARANSIKLTLTVGATVTFTISVSVLKEFLRLSMEGIRQMPTPLKIAFVAAIATALIHPRSRAQIIEAGKNLWNKLSNPKFRAMLSSLVVQLLEAHEDAGVAAKEIEAALPKSRKRSALAHAREICLIERGPMTLAAIEAEMKHAGYITRSRNFTGYLRRVLHRSRTFIEVSPGQWALRATVVP